MITKFHTDWYRELYTIAENNDPYRNLKKKSNEIARDIISKFKPEDFKQALLLTIIGNKIDFGACINGIYDLDKLQQDIKNIKDEKLDIDDSQPMIKSIRDAKNVFFLFDNNGEMIFDTILLDIISRFMPKENIFLVAKESPMLNDVTVEDLKAEGMEKYGKIISIGSNCFGLHEEDVSKEFKDIFRDADVIIAKGQAYFEFFTEYNFSNVFNILRVKQEICGENIPTLKPGMNIVMHSARYSGKGVDYRWE